MAFFTPDKLKPRTIEVDTSTLSADSPEMLQRLARIEQNYGRLEDELVELEAKIAADERLQAIDSDDIDFEEEFGVKPKRKWRPTKSRKRRRKTGSANPRKPR